MNLTPLSAISPVDGRYRSQTTALAPYFSEFGLIHYRVRVEIEYLLYLAEIPLPQLKGKIDTKQREALRRIFEQFSEADAQWIKDKERITNHDVKAVEYFVKEKLQEIGLGGISEFVHFGLTSQDINNTSIPLSLKDALQAVIVPVLKETEAKIQALATTWKNIPMLAKTHGQPASPTKLGKEFMVFSERIRNQLGLLEQVPLAAKFGGATGNFNAHHVAYPDFSWQDLGNAFIKEKLGLTRMQFTTQIEHYDHLAALCDAFRRINVILIDLCRDIWMYISMDYFKQKVKENEVGSSAMPHKVNPIDFENAEGNLGVANAVFDHLASKLPISRLQRDLTDSTVLRNLGVPFSHTLIAYRSILKGLDKLILNQDEIDKDLENNWAVVAEAIQTVLRREGYEQPYEALKSLTRGKQRITQSEIHAFIETLSVSDAVKEELKKITPFSYSGIF